MSRIEIEFFPGRPALLNAERSKHWREHRATTRDIRLEARLRWLRHAVDGFMPLVKVDVFPYYASGRLPDTGACIPAVKAIIDGAVDAGLLEHDGPAIVAYLGFHRPIKDADRGDGLLIAIEQIEETSEWAS